MEGEADTPSSPKSLQRYLEEYLAWFRDLKENTKQPHILNPHILKGFTKAFLSFLIPTVLLTRKVSSVQRNPPTSQVTFHNLRRATALGVFVAGVRASNHLLNVLKAGKGVKSSELSNFSDGEQTELERFVKKYSLATSAFISALVGITIDGDIQNSVTVTIWAMIRALRTILPSIPYAEVYRQIRSMLTGFSDSDHVSLG